MHDELIDSELWQPNIDRVSSQEDVSDEVLQTNSSRVFNRYAVQHSQSSKD
jgi:hypothetical protein